jgi:hypothetical protein
MTISFSAAVTGQRPRRFNLILVDLQSLLFQVRMIGCCAKGPNWLDLVYIPDDKGLPRQGKRQSAHFRRDLSCLIYNEQINGAEQGGFCDPSFLSGSQYSR